MYWGINVLAIYEKVVRIGQDVRRESSRAPPWADIPGQPPGQGPPGWTGHLWGHVTGFKWAPAGRAENESACDPLTV